VVARAVERNPSLKAAVIQLRDAEHAVAGEESRYPWTLGLSAGATRTASPRLIQGENIVGEIYTVDGSAEVKKRLQWGTDLSFSLRSAWQNSVTPPSAFQFIGLAPNGAIPTLSFAARAGVTQPILRGAGSDVNLAPLDAARADKSQTSRALERTASALIRDVRVAYWELWYAEEVVRIQSRARDLAREERDQANLRVTTGSLAPADALALETRLAAREEDVVSALAEAERQRVTLASRVGTLGSEGDLGNPSEESPSSAPPAARAAERDALDSSPDLLELRAAVDSARVRQRTAGDANRPRLDASAFVQVDGLGSADAGAALEQLATFGAWSAHAGLTFEAPLDGGRRRGDQGRARAAVELAEARLEERRQQVLAEVRTALARSDGARRRVELGEETRLRAERQLEAERARYATGSSTALQVLQAEEALRSAALRVARARTDGETQAILLEHLAGRQLARLATSLLARFGSAGAPSLGAHVDARY
jgi:outer membrane protein TolC